MQRLQAYKYELMPNGEQQRDMRRFSGACRFVFNKALALQKANTQAGEKFIGYVAMAKRLTDWRNGSGRPGSKMPHVTPCNTPLKTWSEPTRTSLPNALTSRVSNAKAVARAFATLMPSSSNSTK